MQIQLPIRQALAACLALLCMVSLNWIGFYAHMHLGLAMTALGKLALSLLSLSLGFGLYAKRMQHQPEPIVMIWPYALLVVVADLMTGDYAVDATASAPYSSTVLLSGAMCIGYWGLRYFILRHTPKDKKGSPS
jgi:hypothetical protein